MKKKLSITLMALLATTSLLNGCGKTSNVGGSDTNGIQSQAVEIKMMHYTAIVQQLRFVFGLDEDSNANDFLDNNRAIFEAVKGNTITRRNATYKLYIEACRESDVLDPNILFDDPEFPKLRDIWDNFQPGESVPEVLKSGESGIQGIDFASTSQLRMGLCLLAATSLCNTTQNIPCHVESL